MQVREGAVVPFYTELTEKLIAELPGILNWALDGLVRLRERGRFIQPESGKQRIHELEDLSSPVGAFVKERCEVLLDASASSKNSSKSGATGAMSLTVRFGIAFVAFSCADAERLVNLLHPKTTWRDLLETHVFCDDVGGIANRRGAPMVHAILISLLTTETLRGRPESRSCG